MRKVSRRLMLLLAMLGANAADAQSARPDPAELARRIGDRIVADTVFHLDVRPANGMQQGFYPLAAEPGDARRLIAFAADIRCTAACAAQPIDLRYSASPGDLRVLIDGKQVFAAHLDRPVEPRERDYNLVDAPIAKRDALAGKPARIVILFRPSGDAGFVAPGLTIANGTGAAMVSLAPAGASDADKSVRFVRARLGSEAELPAALAELDAKSGGRWRPVRAVERLENADPLDLSDWRYFTGATLSGMLAAADRFGRPELEAYTARHIGFFLDNVETVRAEREAKHQLDGPFAHYFRFALLDDVGPQSAAMIEWNARLPAASRVRRIDALADPAIKAILGVPRLADGTMVRRTPANPTIWADDLYMGAASLARIGTALRRPALLDEAARQTLLFDKWLRDPASGLYHHGWFPGANKPSASKWARANGWTLLAKLQVLKALPGNHRDRAALLRAFVAHARALKARQAPDGRWHQVLDNPQTYLETSASAMFVAAFAEGVTNGWLDAAEFDAAIDKGWRAVAAQTRPDGRVDGIVQGTAILANDAEYQAQKTRASDPRGLAAMLFACIAVADWQQHPAKH